MENKDSKRAFNEMLMVAKDRLKDKSPEDIAKKSGTIFDAESSTIKINSLGQTINLKYPSYDFEQSPDDWYILIALHYLDLADGTPVYSQPVHFGELKDGLIRGVKFDKTAEVELTRFVSDKEPEQIKKVFENLGAEFVKSKADLSAVIPFFPNYPVTINVWFADDEFDAEVKMFVDKSADRYLTIEDSVMLGEAVIRYILRKYDEIYGK